MNRILSVALPGVVLLAACSERQPVTAPSAEVAPSPAATSGDRSYKWSLSCHSSDNYFGGIAANWAWTENGVTIAGTEMVAVCSIRSSPNKVGGSGVRPANANGFIACVGDYYCQNWTSWTFDPTGAFRTQLKGSLTDFTWCFPSKKCPYLVTTTGTLNVDS